MFNSIGNLNEAYLIKTSGGVETLHVLWRNKVSSSFNGPLDAVIFCYIGDLWLHGFGNLMIAASQI